MKPQFWQMPSASERDIQALAPKIQELDSRLQHIAHTQPNSIFASSLAAEDAIITDRIAQHQLPIRIITLNTGLLHAETAQLIAQTQNHYPQIQLQVFEPQTETAVQFTQKNGAAAMYQSIDLRKQCCHIRKIEPLNRALQHASAWLTGQRRSQSVTRSELAFAEHDTARQIAKFNPIFDWEDADVWAYVQSHDLPMNALYQQGYPSIGCEPCTRPVKLGEDIRAGRWWWEQQDSKECGLHK
ncbi:MAG: phosphoadenylyl-sulfate reductase [Neisseria sp.]|nr:phosphoadenylyl-sulfate reductase [Neisseria sp.]